VKTRALHKRERLRSRKIIEKLFLTKQYFTIYPFRIYWSEEVFEGPPLQMAVGVPKKLFKKATERNLVKRRTREAYRKKKASLSELLDQNQQMLRFFLLYTAKESLPYQSIEQKIELILLKLAEKIQGNFSK